MFSSDDDNVLLLSTYELDDIVFVAYLYRHLQMKIPDVFELMYRLCFKVILMFNKVKHSLSGV